MAAANSAVGRRGVCGCAWGDVFDVDFACDVWLNVNVVGLLRSGKRYAPPVRSPTHIFTDLKGVIVQTPEESFYWFKKAAESGYVPAFGALGDAYKRGRGCKKDIKSAKYWLTKAVIERRSADALQSLLPLIDSQEELMSIIQAIEDGESESDVGGRLPALILVPVRHKEAVRSEPETVGDADPKSPKVEQHHSPSGSSNKK